MLCIARAFFSDPKVYKSSVKELNASDERGIEVVRTEIKDFAKSMVKLGPGQVKIVILDEADSLTEGAQQALRMIISDFSQTTRFVLSCNDSSKLIDPIQSRCVIIRFAKLRPEEVAFAVRRVAESEGVRVTPSGVQAILFAADGDMRQAINNLQACHYSSEEGEEVDDLMVYRVCDTPPFEQLKCLVQDAKNGEVLKALARNRELFGRGYSTYDIVNSLYRTLLAMEGEVPKPKLFEMVRSLILLKKKVLEGVATELQVAGWVAACARL